MTPFQLLPMFKNDRNWHEVVSTYHNWLELHYLKGWEKADAMAGFVCVYIPYSHQWSVCYVAKIWDNEHACVWRCEQANTIMWFCFVWVAVLVMLSQGDSCYCWCQQSRCIKSHSYEQARTQVFIWIMLLRQVVILLYVQRIMSVQ